MAFRVAYSLLRGVLRCGDGGVGSITCLLFSCFLYFYSLACTRCGAVRKSGWARCGVIRRRVGLGTALSGGGIGQCVAGALTAVNEDIVPSVSED